VMHVSVKLWLGPSYVAVRVEQALSRFWSGPVYVGEIEFNYDGIMFVRDIVFYDQGGAVTIEANDVKLVLGDWPSFASPAEDIEVEKVDAHLRIDDGKVSVPLRFLQSRDGEKPRMKRLQVRRMAVRIEDGQSQVVLDRLGVEVNRKGEPYEFNVDSYDEDDASQLDIEGNIDLESREVVTTLKFARKLEREQTAMLLSVLRVSTVWSCEGGVRADLRLSGNFADTESLWPEGMVVFEDWAVDANERSVGRGVSGDLLVRGRHLDLEQIEGVLCKGQLTGSFYVNVVREGPVGYGGDFVVVDVNLPQLTELAGTTKKFTRGTGRLSVQFSGDTSGVESVRAKGAAFLDDSDLWRFPLIGQVFKSIGIWEYQVGGMSDAEVKFALSGPEMTIERGHLSNRFSAIEAEPGGKVNLKSGQIDMYIVAAPLKQVDKVVGKIPVVNWFASFKDKLIRLRLKGHWSEPAGKLISKQPLKDIKDGTIGFIVDIIESGGQFTKKTIQGFGLIFSRPKKKAEGEQ